MRKPQMLSRWGGAVAPSTSLREMTPTECWELPARLRIDTGLDAALPRDSMAARVRASFATRPSA